MHPIIRFDNVSATAQGKTILSEVSFKLYPGEKALLTGKSAAGKSSVLKTLLGLHTATSGSIYFQNQSLSPKSVQSIRSCTAYIGQEPILGAESVRDALLIPFQFKAHRNQHPSEAQITSVLQRLHLPTEILTKQTGYISGGEKQRIALARGLLLGKSLYLLDEVTSALDMQSKQAIFEVFSDPQLTVLAVAHDVDWLERSTTVFEMNAGQLTQVK